MGKRYTSKCWYEEVCSECDGIPCSSMNECVRYLEMSYLMKQSDIPENKQKPILLDGSEDYKSYSILNGIRATIVEFVNSGNNILICSSRSGNGKTSWAIKLMLKYFDSIWAGNGFRVRGLFVHVPTLLMKMKNFNEPLSETYKRNLMEVDLVIWDDIAGVEMSSYDYSNLLMFIDYRLNNEKSNIFTSNKVEADEFAEALGSKLTSRIFNSSRQIIFTGKDRRSYGSTSDNKQGT